MRKREKCFRFVCNFGDVKNNHEERKRNLENEADDIKKNKPITNMRFFLV